MILTVCMNRQTRLEVTLVVDCLTVSCPWTSHNGDRHHVHSVHPTKQISYHFYVLRWERRGQLLKNCNFLSSNKMMEKATYKPLQWYKFSTPTVSLSWVG
jgi:hypothetical protein